MAKKGKKKCFLVSWVSLDDLGEFTPILETMDEANVDGACVLVQPPEDRVRDFPDFRDRGIKVLLVPPVDPTDKNWMKVCEDHYETALAVLGGTDEPVILLVTPSTPDEALAGAIMVAKNHELVNLVYAVIGEEGKVIFSRRLWG